jgi:hypothetical protein
MGRSDSGLVALIGAAVAYSGYAAYAQQGLGLPASILLVAFGALMLLYGGYSFYRASGAAQAYSVLYKARVPPKAMKGGGAAPTSAMGKRAKTMKAPGIPLGGTIGKIVDKLTSQTHLLIALGLILLFALALYSESTDQVIIAITLILLAVILKARDFREGS